MTRPRSREEKRAPAVDQALADLDTMRSREGDHLRADLDARRAYVADLVERVAAAAAAGGQARGHGAADGAGGARARGSGSPAGGASGARSCRPTRTRWRRRSSAWPRAPTSARRSSVFAPM